MSEIALVGGPYVIKGNRCISGLLRRTFFVVDHV